MVYKMKDLFLDIAAAFGPSGDEEPVRECIKELVSDYADEISTDALGNLIVLKKGESSDKKIMFAAHMDSIGLMATYIEDNGCIRFTALGGVAPLTVANQKVIFKNDTVGVVTFEGKSGFNASSFDNMYIDIGTSSREETLEFVNVGDSCVYLAAYTDMANDNFSSTYVDNRISCAILVECIRTVKKYKYDTYYVFTTQEEVGMRGAKTAAFAIMPDVGIAVDVTIAGDTVNPSNSMPVKLGAGPAIKIRDKSLVCSPAIKQMLVDTAAQNGIPYQMEVLVNGGTDAAAMQLAGAGIPSGAISIPMRYVHTMSETANMYDVENTKILIDKVIEQGAGL